MWNFSSLPLSSRLTPPPWLPPPTPPTPSFLFTSLRLPALAAQIVCLSVCCARLPPHATLPGEFTTACVQLPSEEIPHHHVVLLTKTPLRESGSFRAGYKPVEWRGSGRCRVSLDSCLSLGLMGSTTVHLHSVAMRSEQKRLHGEISGKCKCGLFCKKIDS